jgi:CRISPR-associated endonuclease Cas1
VAAASVNPESKFEQIEPRHGVVTLRGFGSKAYVKNGHLILEDGIGASRTILQLPRVGHKLNRLVVIGSDGFVSFEALRWLADQDAAFVMLNRNGKILATCGPVHPSDARLRRAQAIADFSGTGLQITRELVGQKLANQERVARKKLRNDDVADEISKTRAAVSAFDYQADISVADLKKNLMSIEAKAANAYWSAWRCLPVQFFRADFRRIPGHWTTFGARISMLTGSPRLAINPPNAILNYLYAILESETRLAAAAVGLDAGLGFFHSDTANRDSLACDLMEPVRPKVDEFLFDWISREPLKREWFFEQRNGNCRLMGSFAVKLSETACMWRNAVAPHVERAVKLLWTRKGSPPTPLTRNNKRKYVSGVDAQAESRAAWIQAPCRICGNPVTPGSEYCASCAVVALRKNLAEASERGRIATQALRSGTQRRQAAALKEWNPSDNPEWLTEKFYRDKIVSRLQAVAVQTIVSALAVSNPYAANIRSGKTIPHPRHWLALANLAQQEDF